MELPQWARNVLLEFERRKEPFGEYEISSALRRVQDNSGPSSEQELKAIAAEWTVFAFYSRPDKDSPWNTYFAPMASGNRQDGTEFFSPDIKNIDVDTVMYWESRAGAVQKAAMRARYADAVWDLKFPITGEKPSHDFALIAIDGYLDAIRDRSYVSEMDGFDWLRRALDLALSVNDRPRALRVVEAILKLCREHSEPQHVGVWIIPFDSLYTRKDLITAEQESAIIADLEMMLATTSDPSSANENPHAAQAAAERLAQHYNRTNDRASVQRVIKTYGQAFENAAKEASPVLAIAWLQPVIERYEQVGLKGEAERLQKVCSDKGEGVGKEMKEISAEVEITKEELDKFISAMVRENLSVSLLQIAAHFIPKVETANEFLEMTRKNAPLSSLFPTVFLDAGGIPTAKIGSLDGDHEGHLHKQLGEMIAFGQPFLVDTLTAMRERYSPSVADILRFLAESPLFPNERSELLREGLVAYEQEDFVKAIHVLVPQIEHTLRSFLVLIGVPPLKTVRLRPGIMDAKSMNDILSDERVKKVLTEDLWRYLYVLYIERRGGLNLRNDLAHGLAHAAIFTRPIADRVFHSLLALSLVRKQETKS